MVFFSGEDNSELQTNAPKHSLYLSLIVNNRNEMCAKVAQYQELTYGSIKSKRRNFNGDEELVDMQPIEENVIYTYDCEISKPEDLVLFNADWKVLADTVVNMKPPVSNVTVYNGGKQGTFFNETKGYTNKGWNSKKDELPRVDIKFVRQNVLGATHQTLNDAAKKYKYQPLAMGELIESYEEYYNTRVPTYMGEEIVYNQIIEILKPYSDNKEIIKLLNEINIQMYEYLQQ